jgi:CRP-like cAMP-binding protein
MVIGEYDVRKMAQQMADLWNPLTEEQRQMFVDSIVIARFGKNEIIYHENDEPQYLYCLIRGKVKIYKEGVGGRQQIVRMVSPRGFFGYRAGFSGGAYIAEAAALEPVTLSKIPLPVIKHIIVRNHFVAIFFIRQLASLLGTADEHTVNLTQKHLRGRLAESLLELKDSYGTEDDNSTLAIAISREDLANLSNMTTSNAIRTLSSFASDELIAIEGRKISLLNEAELKRISETG